jgi:hypothetical protein
MIKFFRKIRQSLLSENKFSKYILYAIGEILLVVIGILIALQLNTNAENKKLNEKRQEYSNQLIEDLQREIQFFNEFEDAVEKDEYEYNQYLRIYEKPELKPIEIYNELVKLRMYSNTITFNSSTIESLRSSGELILFPLEIRNKLINLLRMQAEVQRQREANNNGKNSLLMHLGRIRGASTFINSLEGHSALKEYLNVERNLPDIILGLDAAHKWKNLSETQTLKDLELIKKDMEAIIELIKTEMN